MAAVGRDALLKGTQKRERKQVGALGAEVAFRRLSVAQRLACSSRFAGVKEGDVEGSYRAALAQVVLSLCNDDDTPMFDDGEIDARVEDLMQQDSVVVEGLIEACLEVQGTGKQRVKEAVGNSDEIPSGSSSSGSAGISDTPARKVSLSA